MQCLIDTKYCVALFLTLNTFPQDTLCLGAPYPFRLDPLEDFDLLTMCAQLMQCNLKGNLHNTIPHSLCHAVPTGAARRFQARQQDRQQAFRSQYLDVALWESITQKDLSGGCGGDVAEACPRSKTEGG